MNWKTLNKSIIHCEQCPRLRNYCKLVALKPPRRFKNQSYWSRPVQGFGDQKAQFWIIGLAPSAHGANRTGRMFTGDRSGAWLYRALFESGFANQKHTIHRNDGLKLKNAYISAILRCAPPKNLPQRQEIARCLNFLREEWELLERKKIILALGEIAFKNILKLYEELKQKRLSPFPSFSHGTHLSLDSINLLASYHPSPQNTFTGKLTWQMWISEFQKIRVLLSKTKSQI